MNFNHIYAKKAKPTLYSAVDTDSWRPHGRVVILVILLYSAPPWAAL